MALIKDVLEIVYYISFIVLTALIVYYAYKTYRLQSEETCKLLCKIYILKETLGSFQSRYALEIFNHGNKVAEKVKIVLNGEDITVVDFVKPNESFMFPVGELVQMIESNRVWLDSGEELQQGAVLDVQLVSVDAVHTFQVNTDLLFTYRGTANGTLSEVADAVKEISFSINRLIR